jgi:hypothetical protein
VDIGKQPQGRKKKMMTEIQKEIMKKERKAKLDK